MAQVFDRAQDFLSIADQGQSSDHECAVRGGARVATVPNLEDRRARGVAGKAFIVGSEGLCRGVSERRRRPCAGYRFGAKRADLARIWRKMENRNFVRRFENTRVSA